MRTHNVSPRYWVNRLHWANGLHGSTIQVKPPPPPRLLNQYTDAVGLEPPPPACPANTQTPLG